MKIKIYNILNCKLNFRLNETLFTESLDDSHLAITFNSVLVENHIITAIKKSLFLKIKLFFEII